MLNAKWKQEKLSEAETQMEQAFQRAKDEYEVKKWLLDHDLPWTYPDWLFSNTGPNETVKVIYKYGEALTKAEKTEVRAALKEFPWSWELDGVMIPAYAPKAK